MATYDRIGIGCREGAATGRETLVGLGDIVAK